MGGAIEAIWDQLSPTVQDSVAACVIDGDVYEDSERAVVDPIALLIALLDVPEGMLPRVLRQMPALYDDLQRLLDLSDEAIADGDEHWRPALGVAELLAMADGEMYTHNRDRMNADDLLVVLATFPGSPAAEVFLHHGLDWSLLHRPSRLQMMLGGPMPRRHMY